VSAFFISAGLIFIAELGDKSQLIALWFATRYRWWIVLAGITAATLVLNLGSVIVGSAFGEFLPDRVALVIVGVLFLAFAAWSLRGEEEHEEEAQTARRLPLGPFGVVTAAFFLAEFGDKTQLATIAIAGREGNLVAVWLGATAGMVAANGLAIALGRIAGKRLPARTISIIAALLFAAFGVLALIAAAGAS
jgi:Ca2+/H+ antiporter, TMEM165/GDT1 family